MKHALLISLFLAFKVSASSVPDGQISEVRTGTWYGEKVLIKLTPAPDLPDCNTLASRGHYVIDLTKKGAYAWLSIIMEAKNSKSSVTVWGTGTCIAVNGLMGEELETIAVR